MHWYIGLGHSWRSISSIVLIAIDSLIVWCGISIEAFGTLFRWDRHWATTMRWGVFTILDWQPRSFFFLSWVYWTRDEEEIKNLSEYHLVWRGLEKLLALTLLWGSGEGFLKIHICKSCDVWQKFYRDRTGDKWKDRRLRKLLFLHNSRFNLGLQNSTRA